MTREDALAELRGLMVKIAGELLTVPIGDNRHTARQKNLQAMTGVYEAIAADRPTSNDELTDSPKEGGQ